MQSVYDKFNDFQRQSQSERDMVKVDDLNRQINRLEQLKANNKFQKTFSQKNDIEHFIKVYKLAVKQIGLMKMQFTKPSQVKEKLAEIFRNQKQQNSLQGVLEKSSDIRSSEIEIPTFKNSKVKENVIDAPNELVDLGSPGLRNFFQKKQAELMNRGTPANFKSVLQNQSSKSIGKSSNNRSISREQPSGVSRSSASSFNKNFKQLQLKKILQENRKIKQEYEKRLKREMQLNEFEKKLLKDEKNRYMLKIQEMQSELQNVYIANYKLKEEVEMKQKELKQRASFEDSSSFRNLDENIKANFQNKNDYYQPYVMKTKHNDLRRLNNKYHSEVDLQSERSKNDFFMPEAPNNLPRNINQNGNNIPHQNQIVDVLGNELEKQLKELQKQRSRQNNSRISSKKWSRQYNPDKYQQNASQKQQQKQEFLRVLRQDDEQELKQKNEQNDFTNKGSSKPFQKTQNNVVSKQFQGHSVRIYEPQEIFYPTQDQNAPYLSSYYKNFHEKAQNQSIEYKPSPNYEFSRTVNRDYSIRSNLSNCDTFQMARTYLNMSQNEQQSLTNKYIDSKTSTRNKVAFFKDSLILIKNDTFQLAFKRSALVETKDRVRLIFFIKNKTNYPLQVNFKYQYDASYFKIKVNEKLSTVLPQSQAREDLEVFAYSTIDLNQVVDILLQVNSEKYGLWLPILWIEFSQNENFNMPSKNQEISIIPDRQFKSYDTARTIIPLTFGGMNSTSQWAYLFGKCKFGPCYIKLIWEMNELKLQTNAKWIDVLAFVMHHVK